MSEFPTPPQPTYIGQIWEEPVGSYEMWIVTKPGEVQPCRGQLLKRADYPELAVLVADLSNKPDDPEDSFRVPDLVFATELPPEEEDDE